jgi:Protein of unknown function (DUF2652)
MTAGTEHGYLVLADISGYTSFLAKVELEHADEILTELMNVILEQFKPVLTISKLEGDAVFANVSETRLPVGERLLELIENTYFAFRQCRDASQRQTTCTCRACQAIPSLELKFFVHHGDYIIQDISGIRELVGTDVNLVHRLMKNHITESTGWRAYILFTQKAIEHMDVQPEGLFSHVENYEYLGDIPTLSMDLRPRYEIMVVAKRTIIERKDADICVEYDFDGPPHIIWDWINDINLRSLAMGVSYHWMTDLQPGRRRGPGAVNHCAHGRNVSSETILDWRPFEYVTSFNGGGGFEYTCMIIFTALENGSRTHVELRMALNKSRLLWMSRLFAKTFFAMDNPYLSWFSSIEKKLQTGKN